MRQAVRTDAELGSPSVGTWFPTVGLGAPVVPGHVLGHLLRDGRRLPITAPKGSGGVAVSVAKQGSWVAYGDALVTMGEGGAGFAVALPTPTHSSAGPEGAVAVCAETDGTIYLSREPGAPSFAAVGDVVAVNDTVALVEVMKTFTPVRSPIAGKVARVDAPDGGSVQEGDALFWILPG